jgi:hypothetical protein
MPDNKRYPNLGIRSKNELAKRISSNKLSPKEALLLINDVLVNFDKYWYDSSKSDPDKEKYVRSSVGTNLGKLLKLLDQKVLAQCDSMVPHFFFGGLSKKNHIRAAYYLLGNKRYRTLLALDISRFFEQIERQRIFHLFNKKFKCSVKASDMLASLCCVPSGPKNNGSSKKVLARGFATSVRLALWSNLDLFVKLKWLVQENLKKYDPRMAVFVDDIGITASRVDAKLMESLRDKIRKLFDDFDPNQPLPLNEKKIKILSYDQGIEHLGLRLNRNSLSLGKKTLSKKNKITQKLKQPLSILERSDLKQKRKSLINYQKQITGLK